MMDRNVYARRPAAPLDEGTPAPPPEQPKPAEKLLKYFPAEAFALYATLEPLMDTAFDGTAFKSAMWGALAALGGPFATLDWFKPAFALIAAALMSAFIIFAPAPTAPEV